MADQSNTTCFPNATGGNHAPVFTPPLDTYQIVVLSVIGVLAVAGNTCVLCNIFCTKSKDGVMTNCKNASSTCGIGCSRNSRNMYRLLAQLAVSDLLVSGADLLAEAAWKFTVQWYADEVSCKLLKFMQMFALYMSIFTIVLIGIDQYFVIGYPLLRSRFCQYIRRAMVSTWFLSAILSIPQAIIFKVIKGPFVEDFYQCMTDPTVEEWQMKVYTTFTFVIMFLVPLIVLIFTYSCTFYTISSSEKLFRQNTNYPLKSSRMESTREKVLHKAKIRSLKISVVIVVAFVVCWTPYYVMMIAFMYLKPDPDIMDNMMAGIFFFGSSTALINPLIYGAFHLHRKRRARHHSSMSTNSNHPNLTHRPSRTVQTERFNMSINGSLRSTKNYVAYDKNFTNYNYSQSFL